MGVITEEFEIKENNDPMIVAIRASLKDKETTWLQNGDGQFYREADYKVPISEGCHIRAHKDFFALPFGAEIIKRSERQIRKFNDSDVDKEYYPKYIKNRLHYPNSYSGEIINLQATDISDLEIFERDESRSIVKDEISSHLICDGKLYRSVPEPYIRVSVNEAGTIRVRTAVPMEHAQLRADLSETDKILYCAALSDEEKALEVAQDLASLYDFSVDPFDQDMSRRDPLDWVIIDYSPLTTYAEDISLLHMALRIKTRVAKSLGGRSSNEVFSQIADWTPEMLQNFQALGKAIDDPEWFNDIEHLNEIVDLAFAQDGQRRKPLLFPTDQYDHLQKAYQQWQLRSISTAAFKL